MGGDVFSRWDMESQHRAQGQGSSMSPSQPVPALPGPGTAWICAWLTVWYLSPWGRGPRECSSGLGTGC